MCPGPESGPLSVRPDARRPPQRIRDHLSVPGDGGSVNSQWYALLWPFRVKSSPDMPHRFAIGRDEHNVKPYRHLSRGGSIGVKVRSSCTDNTSLFSAIDRTAQRSVVQRSPALHLYKHDLPPRLTYYIDLSPSSSEVALKNLVTFCGEIGDSPVFPGPAPLRGRRRTRHLPTSPGIMFRRDAGQRVNSHPPPSQ